MASSVPPFREALLAAAEEHEATAAQLLEEAWRLARQHQPNGDLIERAAAERGLAQAAKETASGPWF